MKTDFQKSVQAFTGQPCLVVGIGGIGHRIVLALKALLVAIFGDVPAAIRLVALDIDEENLSVRVSDRVVTLERDVELFCLGPVPVARIKSHLDNLPTIRNRLPCLANLPPMAVAHAAKQLRPLGQLAFQWDFPRIRTVIRDAIWTLAGRDQRGDESLAVDPGRGLKIVQVGSNCGGTNAGMFIDMGWLLRSVATGLGTLGDACDIIGIGMLPGAFHGVDGPNLAANAVASLIELEAVTMNGSLSATYRDGTVLKVSRPPFDMYLLVDAVDEGGRVWVNREDLCRMVARAILVLAATGLGEQGEGQLDNLDEALSQRTPDGHGTFFGSIGLSSIEFPAEAIVDLFSTRHSQAVIAQALLRVADPAAAQTDAMSWLQAQGLATDALLSGLAQDETGLPLAVLLESPSGLRRLPDAQVPQEAIQFVQAYSRLRLDGDYRGWVRQHAAGSINAGCAHLEEQVRAILNDPRLGLSHGQEFLAALARHVAAVQSGLAARQDRIKAEEVRREAEVNDAADGLIRAANGLWLLRHSQVVSALDHYLQVSQGMLAVRLDRVVVEQAMAVTGAIADRGRELERQLATLSVRLESAAAHLAQAAERHARRLDRRLGNPALVLLDQAYLDALYATYSPDLAVTVGAVLAAAGPATIAGWAGWETHAVAQAVSDAGRTPFEPILAMTVEEVMAGRDEYSPQARLAALLDEARPAWNLDETRLPGGDMSLKRITVVGVPDRAHSLFRTNGNQVVSVPDPHAIVALSLTVGAPFTALQAWPDYLAEYEQARRTRPLHTLPAFQVAQHEGGLALALGLIFGQIQTHGVHFYYHPADELAPNIRLAQGAANAIQALATRDGLIREVMERAEAFIGRIGATQALDKLAAYYAPAAGDDELARELKRLVRDYADVLRANARVAGGRA